MAKPLRLLTIIGARPQIIKAAALGRAVQGTGGRIVETILHTGQHYDDNMSQVFFDELGIAAPDINLNVGSGGHGVNTARMIEGIERVLLRKEHDVVLLYGDTNSTLAGALAAAKLHVPVAHIEAGLRSFDKSMPEEINRILCDHCSTWLFCPTETAIGNLAKEGFEVDHTDAPTMDHPVVIGCGDVMFDNALFFKGKAEEHSGILKELGLRKDAFVLVTVHRQNNTDDPVRLNGIFSALLELHTQHGLTIVLPIHPRTHKMMQDLLEPQLLRSVSDAAGFHLVPPVGFLDMIALESNAIVALTDSGGVQKEAYFYDRPSVVMRANTEWVEQLEVGQAVLVDADPARIVDSTLAFIRNGVPDCPRIYGDGHAAERICQELLKHR